MGIPIIILLLASALALENQRSCSSVDKVAVRLDPPIRRYEMPDKTTVKMSISRYPETELVTIMMSKWTASYCPAVELSPFQDCIEREGRVFFTDNTLKETIESGYTLCPDPCDGGRCDGTSEQDCLQPSSFGKCPYSSKSEPKLSSSWVTHRCIRVTQSTSERGLASLSIESPGTYSLAIPFKGSCLIKENRTSCQTSPGWVFKTDGPIAHSEEVSEVPCLKLKDEVVCYDEITHQQIAMQPNGCSKGVGVLFCYHENSTEADGAEGKFTLVTPEMLHELSYQILYDNMASTFNAIQLQRTVDRLQSVIKSMILFNVGITKDPLQEIFGFGASEFYYRDGLLVGKVCSKVYEQHENGDMTLDYTSAIDLVDPSIELQDYEKLRSDFPFFFDPVDQWSDQDGVPKGRHGSSNIVDVHGALSWMVPEFVKEFLGWVFKILPIINFMLLFIVIASFRRAS